MSPRSQLAFLALATLVAASSCSKDEVGPDPARAGQQPAPKSCRQDRPGSPMVLIPKPNGAFCIDQREATRGDYAGFLKAFGPLPKDGPAVCKENKTYKPMQKEKPQPLPGATTPVIGCWDNATPEAPEHPELAINCVDWCDAHAFCAWAGKRLCTAIGGLAPTIDEAAKAGEWNLACSNGGKTAYPYGDQYEAGRCVDMASAKFVDGFSSTAAGATGACSGLEAPYSGLQDMSGGVAEWTDGRVDTPSEEAAYQNGGNSGYGADSPSPLGCWYTGGRPFSPPVTTVGDGIRCCADD